jgi:threonine synthase
MSASAAKPDTPSTNSTTPAPSARAFSCWRTTASASWKRRRVQAWRDIFDLRAATKNPALRGIFRFYELMAPVVAEQDIVYLGEGNTPVTRSSPALERLVGQSMAFKNDGQNPSASFKDRGMACAYSYLRHLVAKHGWDNVLTICASTGDTSAAAALYAAYVGKPLTSVVLLPKGKVTAQQLSQPLGQRGDACSRFPESSTTA